MQRQMVTLGILSVAMQWKMVCCYAVANGVAHRIKSTRSYHDQKADIVIVIEMTDE